jgi:hypothetical protein
MCHLSRAITAAESCQRRIYTCQIGRAGISKLQWPSAKTTHSDISAKIETRDVDTLSIGSTKTARPTKISSELTANEETAAIEEIEEMNVRSNIMNE